MRSSEEVIYHLIKMSNNPNYVFERIYRNLYNPNLYLMAIGNLYSNNGSGTEGTDGNTIDKFGMEEIQKLINELKNESYQPRPTKRIMIPKANGKLRPLSIPCFRDRVVQEIVRIILESIYEKNFKETSHGFRKGRSCHTALAEVKKWQGTNWFIEGDIKGCFDNINHQILINILKEKISDEKFLRLIWKFLKCGYMENWKYNRTFSGTPQGGIMSPILANIYLDKLDRKMEEIIQREVKILSSKRKINSEYYKIESHYKMWKKKLKDKNYTYRKRLISRDEAIRTFKKYQKDLLNTPYYSYDKNGHINIKYVRYADDFVIGIDGTKNIANKIKAELTTWFEEYLKLELSKEKTKITNALDGIKFLGYEVRKTISNDYKRIKGGSLTRVWNNRILLYMPENFARDYGIREKLIKDVDSKSWSFLSRGGKTYLSDLEIMMLHKQERDGLYNYYCMAVNVPKVMRQIDYMLMYVCLKTLAHKHKTSRVAIRNKYRLKDKDWGIKYKVKSGEEKILTWKKALKYEPNPKFAVVDQTVFIQNGLLGRTELEARLRADKCEWCGSSDNIQIHHVKKLSDLKGKNKYEINMISRKRKTMLLCKKCHMDLHSGKLN